jgi:hypothetical protein
VGVVSPCISGPVLFSLKKKNMKSLGYLKCAGASSILLDQKERIAKFRPSALLFIYSCVMLLFFLFSGLAMIFGNIFNDNMDNVYTFAAMMKSSAYVISHGPSSFLCFCFAVKFLTFCMWSCLSPVRFISLRFLSTVTLIK